MNSSPYFYTVLRAAPLAVSTIGTLALARQLGIGEFGRYASAAAFAQIVVAVGLFGQDQLAMQGRLAPARGLIRSGLTVACSATIGTGLGLVLLPRHLYAALVFVVLATALSTWVSILLIYVQYDGDDLRRAKVDLGTRMATQGGSNGLVIVWTRAAAGALGGLIGSLVAAAYIAWRLPATSYVWRQKVGTVEPRFGDAFGYGLVGLLYSVTLVVPAVVVAATSGPTTNAFTRMIVLWYAALTAVGSAISGEYFRVRLYAANSTSARRVIWFQMRKVLALTSIGLTCVTPVAALLAPAALGHQYRPIAAAFALLALDVLPQFVAIAFGTLLMSNGYTRPNITRHAAAFIFTLVACLTISPLTPMRIVTILIINDVLAVAWYWGTRARWGIDATDPSAVGITTESAPGGPSPDADFLG